MTHAERSTARPLKIRFLVLRDFQDVLAIDAASMGDLAWTEKAMLAELRKTNSIGYIAESPDDHVIGFMVYALEKQRINVLRFAVDPAFRHGGIGTALLARLRGKLGGERRLIRFDVPETRDSMIAFLRASDVPAIGVIRGADGEPDDYRFFEREAIRERILAGIQTTT